MTVRKQEPVPDIWKAARYICPAIPSISCIKVFKKQVSVLFPGSYPKKPYGSREFLEIHGGRGNQGRTIYGTGNSLAFVYVNRKMCSIGTGRHPHERKDTCYLYTDTAYSYTGFLGHTGRPWKRRRMPRRISVSYLEADIRRFTY